MAMTGPQWYPGADTEGATRYDDNYPGNRQEVNVIVWHSTEGTSLPSYGGGSSAPTLTAVPDFKAKRLVWYQHFPFDMSARALVNQSGGVETNTLNVAQVEVVGTCDPKTRDKWKKEGRTFLYMPELPDWAVRDLGAFSKWAKDKHGVPLTADVTFKAYPGSYGKNGVRMSFEKWNNYRGHCGHQHVPENDHGDPGSFPMAAILKAAGSTTSAPKPPATKPPAKPVVDLSNLIKAAKTDPRAPQGKNSYPNDVKPVEAALDKLNYLAPGYAKDGHYGTTTISAYSKLQRYLGYTGADADGVPGKASLTWLANKTGLFTVKD